MIEYIDAVIGLQNGDEGKGAVTSYLASLPDYNIVMRCQGGSNAGHTIYHHGRKIVTHIVPCGILHDKISIIGSGCVINEKKFHEEVDYLKSLGYNTSLIKIAKNAHIVTDEHVKEEENESKIGTTKQGIGPCVRDKYSRKGIRAESIESLKPYLIDLYDYFYTSFAPWFSNRFNPCVSRNCRILIEGAQGFELDIDHGDYPYVTSSHTTLAGCLLNFLDPRKIRNVYGCAKVYETYVGSKQFQDKDEPAFEDLAILGNEFGSTTGRKRQCNWLDLQKLNKAIDINSCTHLILSKCDILRKLNEKYENKKWILKWGQDKAQEASEESFYCTIENSLSLDVQIFLRNSPEDGIGNIYSL